MPKPTGPSRNEVKARVRAKAEAERALPARDRILAILSAVRTHGEAEAMLAEVEAAAVANVESRVREAVAVGFVQLGESRDSVAWGEAHDIAIEGLCVCRGGSKACPEAGAR
ncbi:hypothetical protein [Streptomyces sp. NPDC020747]|uniref:hypothetical protein n=1 Tax=Streptomyces sp. NPDC020747 TaxID=3365086 RepID=UPI0037B68D36